MKSHHRKLFRQGVILTIQGKPIKFRGDAGPADLPCKLHKKRRPHCPLCTLTLAQAHAFDAMRAGHVAASGDALKRDPFHQQANKKRKAGIA